ncbi:10222_t:CDS:2 [Gigaspora rosea]|nr:10222_t:CDS:2 [Gigaspora rosea]
MVLRNFKTLDGVPMELPREFIISSRKDVTFGVFIVPEVLAHDFKQWIEMDKFKYKLKATGETIISRACELSSIIRNNLRKYLTTLQAMAFQIRNLRLLYQHFRGSSRLDMTKIYLIATKTNIQLSSGFI